ncbi:MAG: hypothetical protein JNM31_09905 [Flavobacteriales bacterium]|nr:hypothetical protein [Flavobacteriales bacterium]
MHQFTIALLLVSCASAWGQTDVPRLPGSGSSIAAFIPDRWLPLDTATGDLNNDQRDDVVLVLQCMDTIPGDTTGMDRSGPVAPPRKLVVLFAATDGYRLALDNDRFILRADEGGWFDPFEGVVVKDGRLMLSFYGGSAWRWGHGYAFRHGDNGFELIGAEVAHYHASTGEGEARSIDFIAGRMKVTSGNITEDEEQNVRTIWKDLPPAPLRTFDTFVRPFTWQFDADLTL